MRASIPIVIKNPADLRDSPIVRALRGEKIPEQCFFRPSGKIHPYGVAAGLNGAQVPIKCGNVELGVATMELREDGLYFTNITPTPAGAAWALDPKIPEQQHIFVMPKNQEQPT